MVDVYLVKQNDEFCSILFFVSKNEEEIQKIVNNTKTHIVRSKGKIESSIICLLLKIPELTFLITDETSFFIYRTAHYTNEHLIFPHEVFLKYQTELCSGLDIGEVETQYLPIMSSLISLKQLGLEFVNRGEVEINDSTDA